MANMGYCRFENTLSDVEDCLDAIDNQNVYEGTENLKAKRMIRTMLDYCRREGIIENYDDKQIVALIDNATEKDEEE